MLLNQAQKIQSDSYKPDIIIGIARGGIVPSRILADLLETKDFTIIAIEYYLGIAHTKQAPILKQCLNVPIADKKVLLVDDVSDEGKSLQLAKKHIEDQGAKEVKIATIYSKPRTITKPDYYEKQTSNWIVFPWEAKETIDKIIQNTDDKHAINQQLSKPAKAGFSKKLGDTLLNGARRKR